MRPCSCRFQAKQSDRSGNVGAAAVRDRRAHHGGGQDAGLTQIDHLITTHWHTSFRCHGGARQSAFRSATSSITADRAAQFDFDEFLGNLSELYGKAKAPCETGDTIAIAPRLAHLTSAGEALKTALQGREPHSVLRQPQAEGQRPTEKRIGRQRHHVGKIPHRASRDLTWNKEFDLMCR